MNWLQKLAWEEAFILASRPMKQIRLMGFASKEEALLWEFNRVSRLKS